MLTELAQVCDWLREERAKLLSNQNSLANTSRDKEYERSAKLRQWVNDNLPDLKIETIDALARKLPAFVIPTTSFLGFFRRVESGYSLESQQIPLRRFIETVRGHSDPSLSEAEDILKEIQRLDTEVHQKALAIEAIDRRLKALEKLRVDETKLKPEMKKRVRTALKKQLERRVIHTDDDIVGYDDGVDVLELWLWHQILFANDEGVSELYIEPESSPGGDFGGGGASGEWTDSSSLASEAQADSVTGLTETDHASLGSASFS